MYMQDDLTKNEEESRTRNTIDSDQMLYVLRFFFQAEDGIRDGHVTGVQTCALPISAQRIAIIYSFFATCKAQEINPYIWLKETLDKIPNHPVNRLDELLPRKLTKAEEIPKM